MKCLDAVISAGYRVNSKRGTQFRIWATSVLRDHLLKGYSLNERRLRELNQTIRLIADRRKQTSGKGPPDPRPYQPHQPEGAMSQTWPQGKAGGAQNIQTRDTDPVLDEYPQTPIRR